MKLIATTELTINHQTMLDLLEDWVNAKLLNPVQPRVRVVEMKKIDDGSFYKITFVREDDQ